MLPIGCRTGARCYLQAAILMPCFDQSGCPAFCSRQSHALNLQWWKEAAECRPKAHDGRPSSRQQAAAAAAPSRHLASSPPACKFSL